MSTYLEDRRHTKHQPMPSHEGCLNYANDSVMFANDFVTCGVPLGDLGKPRECATHGAHH